MKNSYKILLFIFTVLLLSAFVNSAGNATCNQNAKPALDCMFADNTGNVLRGDQLRVFNGQISVAPRLDDVLGFRNPLAPPFLTSDFEMTMTIDGEKVAPSVHYWRISDMDRGVRVGEYAVQSTITLSPMGQAFLALAEIYNLEGADELDRQLGMVDEKPEDKPRTFNLVFSVKGNLNKAAPDEWNLWKPLALDQVQVSYDEEGKMLSAVNGQGGFYCRTNLEGATFEDGQLKATMNLMPAKRKIFHFVCVLGDESDRDRLLGWYTQASERVRQTFQNTWLRVDNMFTFLPHIKTENKSLRKFYDSSAASLLMSNWEMPERFVTQRFYSSGGLDGAALPAWLSDYGKISKMLTLADPGAMRYYIGLMVNMNPRAHGGYEPDTGASVGYRSPDNEYSMMRLIFDHIAVSGDIKIMESLYSGKPLLDILVSMAEGGATTSGMPDLEMYSGGNPGEKEAYLPLRNARRVWMYRSLADIVDALGKEEQWSELLRKKADHLADLINKKMWNESAGWYDTVYADGSREPVYSVDTYGMLTTGAVPDDRAIRMVSRINETEFLDAYGVKGSLPGNEADTSLLADAPGLIETLYATGYNALAEDVLERIMWWGDKLPYYPELVATDEKDYRDFGRANTVTGLSAGQALIFGVFGIEINLWGEVSINPRPLNMANRLILDDFKVRKQKITLELYPDRCEVSIGGNRIKDAPIGKRTVILPESEFIIYEEDPVERCFESKGIINE